MSNMEYAALSEKQPQNSLINQGITSFHTLEDESTTGEDHIGQCSGKLEPIVTAIPVEHRQHHRHPLRDTGVAAYQVLVAATLLESVLLGLPLAYGVFQDHYSRNFLASSVAPWIGVLSTGLPFLGAPVLAYLCQYHGLGMRYYITSGWVLCVVSLLASAFCTSLRALVVTQGLLYGLGSALVDIPILCLVNTWFEKRRGIAYGLIFGGADLLAIAYTFLITHLMTTYGLKITMFVLVAIIFCFGGPPIMLLRVRQQHTEGSRDRRCSISSTDVAFSVSPQSRSTWPVQVPAKRYYKRSIFYIFALANLLQALGYYLPFIYLPSFTTDLGRAPNWSALVLSVTNLAQVFGEVGFGKLSDKVHVKYLVIVSPSFASLSAFILWGLFAAKSMVALLVFSFLFGFFGSGFLALWARMGTLFGEKDAQMVYSTMCFGRGIGSIVSGPISSRILSHSGTASSKLGYGAGKYAGVVLFVGACMASSAVVGTSGLIALAWKRKTKDPEQSVDEDSSWRLSGYHK